MTELTTENPVWSRFTAKAEMVGAVVIRTASQDTVSSALRSAGGELLCTARVAGRFPRAASVLDPHGRQPAPLPHGGAEFNAEVVTAGEFAIAETGSVALNESAADRGACFLAERLWILVSEQDIVTTLDEGMQRMRKLVQAGGRHPLLMTGPSRTADIERVLTIGVHGPRALAIVILGSA